jgi:hypothetical protein
MGRQLTLLATSVRGFYSTALLWVLRMSLIDRVALSEGDAASGAASNEGEPLLRQFSLAVASESVMSVSRSESFLSACAFHSLWYCAVQARLGETQARCSGVYVPDVRVSFFAQVLRPCWGGQLAVC